MSISILRKCPASMIQLQPHYSMLDINNLNLQVTQPHKHKYWSSIEHSMYTAHKKKLQKVNSHDENQLYHASYTASDTAYF